MNSSRMYGAAAAVALVSHLLWIVWVIFGAVCTRNRPLLAGFHMASVSWGIVTELGPWPCPLTLQSSFSKLEPEAIRISAALSFIIPTRSFIRIFQQNC
jgi:Protein of Unknown function (DUF2784)